MAATTTGTTNNAPTVSDGSRDERGRGGASRVRASTVAVTAMV
jgi:hypothetical protein